ncbi:MAG TPA: AbrB/MazE/SpoVT family DNA-binding domain-containing protein [Bryobacteraceae bacterium]|nr:AbrB/MazE/SpoVT family DNA-binding domain-containing protein [Bryobacteraceae bacterium]
MVRKYASRLTSKGQITIPQEIRRRLGLRAGDQVEFVAGERHTVVRRVPAKTDPFKKYEGALGTVFKNRRDINTWLRDLRDPG